MQTRLLRYFVVLARERHFARAAVACNVSQPTLSAGLSALEKQLGHRLVVRDRRFVGLSEEGAAILPWAQQLLAVAEGMEKAATAGAGPLEGEIRLGVIPASVPAVGCLARALCETHPKVTITIRSLTSREIENGLTAFELDGGLTYLDHEPPTNVLSVPLYAERFMFVTHAARPHAEARTIGWADALKEPLCLLHQGMQNRRILDAHLAARGMNVRPVVTGDSYIALLALVEAGEFATIIPDSYSGLVGAERWVRMLAFEDPLPTSRIGLIVPDRNPPSQLGLALLGAARSLRLPAHLHPV